MSILLVHGDSNTVANYTGDGGDWSRRVADARGFSTLTNLAVRGIYSAAVRDGVPDMIAAHPDLAIIAIGTNDCAGGVDNNLPHAAVLATYLANMTAVIEGLQAASIPCLILSPPFSLRVRAAARLPDFAHTLGRLCAEHRVPFVDLVSYMAAQPDAALAAWFYPGDPYHLSHAGHDLVADTIARLGSVWAPPGATITAAPDVAFDVCTVGAYTATAFDHVCSGAQRILFVATTQTSGAMPSVTYGGIPLALLGVATDAIGYSTRLWCLVAPPSGTHAVALAGMSGNFCGQALSYTGYNRSELPTTVHATSNVAGSSRTDTLTIPTARSWTLLVTRNDSTTATAGTGSVRRGVSSLLFEAFDSGGPVPPGPYAMTALAPGATTWSSLMVAFGPTG